MSTMTSENLTGTITDIGPMYPFVGSETLLVVVVVVFWIAWHVVQLRVEHREYDEDAAKLRDRKVLEDVLEREG